jgi:hypothetical protein
VAKRVALGSGIVFAIAAIALAVVVWSPFTGGGRSYPASWDPRVAPIVTAVQRIRGLSFEHPVQVEFLDEAAFQRRTRVGTRVDATDRRHIEQITAQLRAMGLLTGNVDLLREVNTEQQSSVLAYYDPDTKKVVVRGSGPLDVGHRVTLAHELTHVLQDQHFDLNALKRRVSKSKSEATEALRALIEGDAIRVQNSYADELSAADKASYQQTQTQTGRQVAIQTTSVPAVIKTELAAPYLYGPPILRVLTTSGGNRVVDDTFRDSTFTQQVIVNPSIVLAPPSPLDLLDPSVAPRERAVGKSETFGAFDLYLTLASRLDAGTALDAASGWNGGRIRSVQADGRICVRAAVAGTDDAATILIADQLQAWAAALPAGMATITKTGSFVSFRSCDPGPAAGLGAPDAHLTRATTLLELHNGLEAELFRVLSKSTDPAGRARCAALVTVQSQTVNDLLDRPEAGINETDVADAIKGAVPAVRRRCIST